MTGSEIRKDMISAREEYIDIYPTGFALTPKRLIALQSSDLRKDGYIRQGGVAFPSGYGLGTDTQGFCRLLLGHVLRNPEPFQILRKYGHPISFLSGLRSF